MTLFNTIYVINEKWNTSLFSDLVWKYLVGCWSSQRQIIWFHLWMFGFMNSNDMRPSSEILRCARTHSRPQSLLFFFDGGAFAEGPDPRAMAPPAMRDRRPWVREWNTHSKNDYVSMLEPTFLVPRARVRLGLPWGRGYLSTVFLSEIETAEY